MKSKNWSMVLLNPSFQDEETIERRMKRLPFATYGRDWINDEDFIFECFLVFPKHVRYSEACRFFRKGNWSKVNDINEQIDTIRAYESYKEFGQNPYDEIKQDLNYTFETNV